MKNKFYFLGFVMIILGCSSHLNLKSAGNSMQAALFPTFEICNLCYDYKIKTDTWPENVDDFLSIIGQDSLNTVKSKFEYIQFISNSEEKLEFNFSLKSIENHLLDLKYLVGKYKIESLKLDENNDLEIHGDLDIEEFSADVYIQEKIMEKKCYPDQ